MSSAKGYTLVICEKPDAARRVSEALSDGAATSYSLEGTTVFRFSRGKEDFVVCSAQGHIFGVSDPADERSVYPVFDVEWYPADSVDPGEKGAARRISAVRKLSAGAASFVNACDFDVEGETIGFNILRYACGRREGSAKRARFSTLTKEELVRAFDEAAPQPDQGLAKAGRTRHVVDFVWGVNLSRILSQSAQVPGMKYRTVSIGRVQGPTLGFLVEREKDIRSFVPVPSWKVSAEFDAGGRRFWAEHVKSPMDTELGARQVAKECDGKPGVVKALTRRSLQVGPPVPFNISALQKDAYRVFG
ncbi:MAG TPA: DNA topoisomerase, partial [Nitrososphaerales archaeon]|nr:DNA topoisomerase [Nitrososphaerales archaeon]